MHLSVYKCVQLDYTQWFSSTVYMFCYIISDRLFVNDSYWCQICKNLPIRYTCLICSNITARKNRAQSLKLYAWNMSHTFCTLSVSNVLYDIIYILHDARYLLYKIKWIVTSNKSSDATTVNFSYRSQFIAYDIDFI